LERSYKSENESSTVEDYVYKLPPPKSKSEVGLDASLKTPPNLPKDITTSMDVVIVSDLLQFLFFSFTFFVIILIHSITKLRIFF